MSQKDFRGEVLDCIDAHPLTKPSRSNMKLSDAANTGNEVRMAQLVTRIEELKKLKADTTKEYNDEIQTCDKELRQLAHDVESGQGNLLSGEE